MPRKPDFLNVRQHLLHLQDVLDAYKKYGSCPLVDSELRKISLINDAILRKNDETRATGNRKDIRIEAKIG